MASPRYSVVIKDFTNAPADDYSPGNTIMFMDNPHNLAWTEYMNEVGEAFWSMSQKDVNMEKLQGQSVLMLRPHVQIYRDTTLVWGGWLGEIDETDEDVVFYAYSYLSGFYDIVTEYTTEWTGQTVATIVESVFDTAVARSLSRVHWLTQGTIQNPWTTSGGPTGITMPFYRAPYKRVLSVWKELTAYSISDTTNHVIFEITPSGTFNYWRNRKSTYDDARATYGGGSIRSYRRIRRPVERRSQLRVVGTSPTDVNLNINKNNATLRQLMGLSEEPIYFSYIRDATELDRVAATRLSRAGRLDTDVYVSFNRDSIIPYRASGADFEIGDIMAVKINNGLTNVTEDKVIVGQQVVYSRLSENVRLLLADQLDGLS